MIVDDLGWRWGRPAPRGDWCCGFSDSEDRGTQSGTPKSNFRPQVTLQPSPMGTVYQTMRHLKLEPDPTPQSDRTSTLDLTLDREVRRTPRWAARGAHGGRAPAQYTQKTKWPSM